METLLNALQNADCICNQANAHFGKAVRIEQQFESLVSIAAGVYIGTNGYKKEKSS